MLYSSTGQHGEHALQGKSGSGWFLQPTPGLLGYDTKHTCRREDGEDDDNDNYDDGDEDDQAICKNIIFVLRLCDTELYIGEYLSFKCFSMMPSTGRKLKSKFKRL